MPTILEWVDLESLRAYDGQALQPYLHGDTPEDWRTEVHYEFDLRTSYAKVHEQVLNLPVDQCG